MHCLKSSFTDLCWVTVVGVLSRSSCTELCLFCEGMQLKWKGMKVKLQVASLVLFWMSA